MPVDAPGSPPTEAKGKAAANKKKFELKKWNAVALWAWGACLCVRGCWTSIPTAAAAATHATLRQMPCCEHQGWCWAW